MHSLAVRYLPLIVAVAMTTTPLVANKRGPSARISTNSRAAAPADDMMRSPPMDQ
jgi:hypothetical protein